MNNISPKYDPPLSSCPICGSNRIKLYHSDFRRNRIFRCEECTFQFMNPQYSNAYLDEYYSIYIPSEGTEKCSHVFSFYLKTIERFSKNKGAALDYGCGDGQFIESYKQRGWEIFGFDLDCDSTKRVGKRTGSRVECGNFNKINWPGKFDLISMNQVLEHVKDPRQLISDLTKHLNDEGLLFITVPNIRSTSSTVKTFLERHNLRKRRVGAHYATDHHLLYFSPKTLKNLLRNFGYEIIYSRNGHKGLDKYSSLNRFIKKYITEHLFRNSVYLVIAKKPQEF